MLELLKDVVHGAAERCGCTVAFADDDALIDHWRGGVWPDDGSAPARDTRAKFGRLLVVGCTSPDLRHHGAQLRLSTSIWRERGSQPARAEMMLLRAQQIAMMLSLVTKAAMSARIACRTWGTGTRIIEAIPWQATASDATCLRCLYGSPDLRALREQREEIARLAHLSQSGARLFAAL